MVALLAGAAAEAQTKRPRGKKPVAEKDAQPAPAPRVSLGPTPRSRSAPSDKNSRAKLAAATWSRVTGALLTEFLARHPDRALERAWPGISEHHLGTFGSGATLRWREALTHALIELEPLGAMGLPRAARVRLGALEDWLEAELLLLEGRRPSTSDPVGYVQRAFRALRAATEAQWMPLERRQVALALLLRELPDYFRDARTSLVDPAAQWIDLALLDLDDLRELLLEIEESLPKELVAKASKTSRAGPPPETESAARAALEGFHSWLLELRPSAGSRWPRLDVSEWQRLVRLRSGTTWSASEIKTHGLRELARLDLSARLQQSRNRRPSDEPDLAQHAWSASARALQVGEEARLLRTRLEPLAVEFALEVSARTRPELAWLRPSGADSMRVSLALPHGSWPPEEAFTRKRSLQDARAALGVRYGLAGEALHALQSRACRSAPAVLLDNRLLQEGLGLFALDWVSRVDWIENPFLPEEEQADGKQTLAFEFQRGLEAARLVAAIELHVEGLSLEEAAQGLQRRTSIDRDTARVEALAAQRDPLHGLAYLGLIELRSLEERLARLTNPRKGLRLCLLLASRHPDLRPVDMASIAGEGAPPGRARKRMTATTLEKPGEAQQELSRSR